MLAEKILTCLFVFYDHLVLILAIHCMQHLYCCLFNEASSKWRNLQMLPRVSYGDYFFIVIRFKFKRTRTAELFYIQLFFFFNSFSDRFCRMWKVFYDDVNRPNRYLLAKELPTRPDATEIEVRIDFIILGSRPLSISNILQLYFVKKSLHWSFNMYTLFK